LISFFHFNFFHKNLHKIKKINMKEAYKRTLRLMLVLTLVSLFACGDNGSDDPGYSCYPSHILYTYPEHNETDVEGYQVIFVRFTDLMDDSTINESTFTLEDNAGNIVDGSVYFYDFLKTDCFPFPCFPDAHAYFYPSSNLIPSTRYTATLDSTVQCEEGHSLGCNYSWSFTTKADDGIGFWETVSTTGALSEGTAVWTGQVMIVWDGTGGGQYMADTWQAVSTINAPSGRSGHTAVWTGNEMIVWGGIDNGSGISLNTGGRYNPFTDTWQAISTINAPSERSEHTAIWTGTEMIVWGGIDSDSGTYASKGSRYNPVTDTWQAISTINAPLVRIGHTAIWTGNEMIVWGGNWNVTSLETGGRYDPSSDTWQETSTVGAPEGRYRHTAVWTDTEMIVWGGYSYNPLETGGRYDPSSDTWQETSTVGAPEGRYRHTAVWTGTEMIVWGGDMVLNRYGRSYIIYSINTGGVYYPDTNSWQETSTTNTPLGMSGHAAVWTDGEMIVWNGTGGRYIP
jgi:N-acetylneuraminic acid mutarotase